MSNLVKPSLQNTWSPAVRLVARWLDLRERIDVLMEALPPGMEGAERGRCQHLVFGVVRHFGRIESALGRLVAHPPRFVTRAVLFVAAFELIEAGGGRGGAGPGREDRPPRRRAHEGAGEPGRGPARERGRPQDGRRSWRPRRRPGPSRPPTTLADYFSHPEWLVRRWLAEFGAGPTRRLLEWNQSPAPALRALARSVEARARLAPADPLDRASTCVPSGHWAEVGAPPQVGIALPAGSGNPAVGGPAGAEGRRDRARPLRRTRGQEPADRRRAGHGPDRRRRPAGCKDRPTEGEPLADVGRSARRSSRPTSWRAAPAVLKEHGLPPEYRRDPDRRALLQHRGHAPPGRRQVEAPGGRLSRSTRASRRRCSAAAARLLAPGGRLVYSTCSIDAAENEGVVKAFLDRNRGLSLKKSAAAVPWSDEHDGAAAFLLQRE